MPMTKPRTARTRRPGGLAAAIAVLVLAGCAEATAPASRANQAPQTSEAPGTSEAATFRPSEPASETATKVRIAALGEASADRARLLGELLRRRSGAWPAAEIAGVLDAASLPRGLYAVAVLDLRDAHGARLHRIVEDERFERGDAGALADEDIERLAARLATRLALWRSPTSIDFAADEALARPIFAEAAAMDHRGSDALSTGSIALQESRSPKLRFDIAVDPAPGDGAKALTRALADALARRAPAADRGCGCYRLHGKVAIATAEAGRTSVRIDWLVASGDGRPIGEITQSRLLSPESIAARWGKIADEAAETAAEGVLAVVLPSGGREAGRS